MSTNKTLLIKGLKFGGFALPLLFIAPIMINIGFKALKKDDIYIFLIIGIILAITAVFLSIKCIQNILNSFFNKN